MSYNYFHYFTQTYMQNIPHILKVSYKKYIKTYHVISDMRAKFRSYQRNLTASPKVYQLSHTMKQVVLKTRKKTSSTINQLKVTKVRSAFVPKVDFTLFK